MVKKTFQFTPPTKTSPQATPAVDLQILRKTVDDGIRQLEGARVIALDRLRPDPAQPRRDFDGQSLEHLAESIRQEGVLQPLLVRYCYEEDDFMIIAGERRYRAALQAGLTEAPVVVRDIDDTRRYVLQLMENLQREDLNAVDKGRALDHLKTILPGNWQHMADLVGLTRRRVEQLRALPRLPAPLQNAVRANRITEDHARTIARLPERYQEPLLASVESDGLSTRRTKTLVQRVQETLAAPSEAAGATPASSEVGRDATSPAVESPAALAAEVVRGVAEALSRVDATRGPRSSAARPVYERALEFERVLDRMPVLEFQEDRTLLNQIFGRIEEKLKRIRGEDL